MPPGRRLSRRTFLAGAAATLLPGCATPLRVLGLPCARGPWRAVSDAGEEFFPTQPSLTRLRTIATGGPTPDHVGAEREVLDELRSRLGRGLLQIPSVTDEAAKLEVGGLAAPRQKFAGPSQQGSAYDATLAVGRSHVLAAGNFSVAVYSKTGAKADIPRSDLAGWFHKMPDGTDVFDPRAVYDQYADRWILLAAAKKGGTLPTESWLLMSVSKTPDPLGPWWTWVFDARRHGGYGELPPGYWADYPCVGLDEAAIYVTMNILGWHMRGQHTKLRVFRKRELYEGKAATYFDFFELENPVFDPKFASEPEFRLEAQKVAWDRLALSVQPCHTGGRSDAEYLVNTLMLGKTGTVTVWRLTRASTDPRLTCEAQTIKAYFPPTLGAAPQRDEPVPLGTGSGSVRSAITRDGSVWFTFATAVQTKSGATLTSARWYEFPASGQPRLGELATDDAHHTFPGLAVDARRRVTMIACRSAAAEYPSLHWARWEGSSGGAHVMLQKGEGPHLMCRQGRACGHPNAVNGWGDYNAAALDPVDETTVWMHGGVGAKDDKTAWSTVVAAVS